MRSLKTILILSTLIFIALGCDPKEDIDPTVEAAQNITFRQIMPISKFAAADYISVSANEQYMIFSYKEGTSYDQYYSNDGGETAQVLYVYGTYKDDPIQTNISNDGRFVLRDRGVYDLNNIRSGSAAIAEATAVTESGQLVLIQNEGSNGKTFFVDNNGSFESTGQRLTLYEGYYIGVSGEKMGFFDHTTKTIAEFDVTSRTYTQTSLDLDYGRIGGFGQYTGEIKTAYSEGYFAYAKSGGLLIISPEHEVTYYTYPAMGASYHNTVKLRLFGSRAYVELIDGNTYEAHNGELNLVEINFPIERVKDNIYTQGFLENGDRWKNGIIKTSGSAQTYLPLDLPFENLGSRRFTKVRTVGDYAFVSDKIYDINRGTYATSPIGEIIGCYYDGPKTFAYTTQGTYTSMNGRDWQEEATDQVIPNLVTKDPQGVYHSMTVQLQVYVSPGTQARTYSVDLKGYVSNDGVHWELVPETVKSRAGTGPTFMSSGGVVIFNDNNPRLKSLIYVSDDYGANYEHFLDGISTIDNEPLPDDFRPAGYETSSGKFLSATVEDNGTNLTLAICETAKGGCEVFESPVEFSVEGIYDNSTTTTMNDKDELVLNTLLGIYLSSSLK